MTNLHLASGKTVMVDAAEEVILHMIRDNEGSPLDWIEFKLTDGRSIYVKGDAIEAIVPARTPEDAAGEIDGAEALAVATA